MTAETSCPCCNNSGPSVRRPGVYWCLRCGCEWDESCRAPHPDSALLDALEAMAAQTTVEVFHYNAKYQVEARGKYSSEPTLRAALQSLIERVKK